MLSYWYKSNSFRRDEFRYVSESIIWPSDNEIIGFKGDYQG